MKYPFEQIEKKWKLYWEENHIYKTDLGKTEDKIYCLVMFIYPSGSKLHIGHWYNYAPTDSWARFQKLLGKNVFEPIGYDAFGLPAENYAIKTGIHPYDSTMQNIDDIRMQLKTIGCMYDWDAELMTCVPDYYRWNQWLFLQLYKKGLAYKKEAPVNWDPIDKTVLANEQVLPDGTAERSGAKVEKKMLSQWFFKITDYADELLDGLDSIDWPERTKTMQRNWIGRSYGSEIIFQVDNSDISLTVFTTRPDTLFGVTYLSIAPEHKNLFDITSSDNLDSVTEYLKDVKLLSEVERTSATKEKTGVPTGFYAINPINNEKVPIWVADYVLGDYGTGAVMAVPGHDERDFEFAKKFGLPIKKVILEQGKEIEEELLEAYTGNGKLINSVGFNGLDSEIGKNEITLFLEKAGKGKKTKNYRLRDWLISRQRYWGTPIPIVHCEVCGEVPIEEDELPIELPYDVDFKPGGGSPLARNDEFLNVKCPKCGRMAKQDPDTMDTFVDSSWYYLRYLSPNNDDEIFDIEKAKKWTPVDMYVGGAEHSTMHLLYARFIHKFLRDLGLVNSDEPFAKLVHQGTITNQGAKMSKSKGNVVNPEGFIKEYGSDVFRMYLMFMGPYELGGDWSDTGIVGIDRFVNKLYALFKENENICLEATPKGEYELNELNENEKAIYKKVNKVTDRYIEDLNNFRFNTVIAQLMELVNEINKHSENCNINILGYALERLAILISPVAPHLGEECWQLIGKENSLFESPIFYLADKRATVDDEVILAIQVNGKLRATINIATDLDEPKIKELVWAEKNISQHTSGKQVVKEIYIKNKIYNIVVK